MIDISEFVASLRAAGTDSLSVEVKAAAGGLPNSADARSKLRALADFAERFNDRFVRIESIAKVEDGTLRVLDLTQRRVRDAIQAFQGGKVTSLYESEHSRPYV